MSLAPPESGEAETGASAAAPDQVLATVARLLREVIGEEWVDDVEIGLDTSFSEDLELESIEFVALAEQLQGVYGDRVDFVAWLSSMELDEIIGLRVGQLVDHVVSSLQPAGD